MDGTKGSSTIVVGDVHLTRQTSPDVPRDLERVLRRHPGAQLVFVGDFLDLVTDAPWTEPRAAVAAVFGVHASLRRALADFVDGGGELSFIGGNHDAALGMAGAADDLADALGVLGHSRARLVTRPWFVRDRGVHFEHGHMYDPDNAPGHPLVDGGTGLGAHFSAEFIHPTQAFRFMHRNDAMPLELLMTAVHSYGSRVPEVLACYLQTAVSALAKAGPFYEGGSDRRRGVERHARYAEDAGVPSSVVDAVFAIGVPSTLASWSGTFQRLYLDRVLAMLAIAGGAGALTLGGTLRNRKAWGLFGVGGALMATSWLGGQDRYGGNVITRLATAAERLVDETHAKLVVFGHAHREALGDHYANTGSFAWPHEASGRSYLEILHGDRPRALRHRLA